MKSKIINRVRERQRAQRMREAIKMHDVEMGEIRRAYEVSSKEHADNHIRLLKAAMAPTTRLQIVKATRHWWQFWK